MFSIGLTVVFNTSQVIAMMTAKEVDGGNMLHRAADSGHEDIVAAVLEALRRRLTYEEVRAT